MESVIQEPAAQGDFFSADLPVGTVFSRKLSSDTSKQIAYWTGVYDSEGKAVLFSGDPALPGVYTVSMSTTINGSSWKPDPTMPCAERNSPFILACVSAAKNYAESKKLRNDKVAAREALVEWFNSELDDSDYLEGFNDLLATLGMEPIVSKWTVTGTVTYTFEVEVEAASDEEAQAEVEGNFYSTVASELDLEYWDDYDISSVDSA